MAKWNWGGEENQGVGRIPDGSGSHPSGHAGCAVDGASRVDPLRVEIQAQANAVAGAMFIASAASEGEFVTGDDGYVIYWPRGCNGGFTAWTLRLFAGELDRRNAAWDSEVQRYFRDSDGPRMAKTNEDSAPVEDGPARAARHRPENTAYFWLGIQAEGRE